MKKIIILSCESYDNYFRKYLIRSMIKSGFETMYISFYQNQISLYLNEKLLVSYKNNRINTFKIIENLITFKQKSKLIIWNSFPPWKFYLLLRFSFPKAFIIYDIFDYFYYQQSNNIKSKLRTKIIDIIYCQTANRIIVLSRELTRLYRKGYWLNNASHLTFKKQEIIYKRIGIICSIDFRFDFFLLDYIAKNLPEIEIVIYGWIKFEDKDILKKLTSLVSMNKNVKYFGKYCNDDLESILSNIDIGLIPYITNSIVTKYINPDKYFHYLCYGLEVVSTSIPAAYELEQWVHICETSEYFVSKIQDIYRKKSLKNVDEFWKQNNWSKRLEKIEEHIFPQKYIF